MKILIHLGVPCSLKITILKHMAKGDGNKKKTDIGLRLVCYNLIYSLPFGSLRKNVHS